MRPEIKICGLTRAEDVRCAVELGADYLGFVLAPSPRRVSPEQIRVIAADAPAEVRRVGVFVDPTREEVEGAVEVAGLSVVQLHDRRLLPLIPEFRAGGVSVWWVLSVSDGTFPPDAAEVARAVDAVVIDTRVGDRVGGTGVPFDWDAARGEVRSLSTISRVVVAGGLLPASVARAIRVLDPDVVDVSSGVELRPGIKDSQLMGNFMEAVRGAVYS